ncbi:sulfurtransferase TusA family protein [Tindallia californiensis]|uniref:TusA-related sulfurtransferase n=1 Tax=Tindallia californiensis TaxID=159292 RepID=A0A1H3Q6Q2_9FIRM|nr:sulfurtransferase TusA family protein [Tindallia californiensis]SDZ08715.1 TusA-related sulfurtransferase [Tindallia californiensis]
MNKIDTSGLSCPQPVLLTKKALQSEPESLTILVDNETAKANVVRYLKKAGYQVDWEEAGESIQLLAKKS